MKEEFYSAAILLAVSFLLTVVFGRVLVPVLRRRRAGQPILEIGPAWHMSKAGTPTLGGLAFIGGIGGALLLCGAFWVATERAELWRVPALVFGYAVACGCIGFFDDYRKLRKRENKGLSPWEKYLLQLGVSALFILISVRFFGLDTAIRLPFSHRVAELGVFYYPFALLYLTGLVNALNLTDGVDGLLSSTVAVVSVFFMIWGYGNGSVSTVEVGACLLGGTLGFLCFNAHPAKVFMGDTGSLFFGGAVSAVGILTEHPLLILLSGGVFVLEAASVILQVLYFKLSHGKRLLRMAPLHHHFEKVGWSEWRVVGTFSLLGVFFAIAALWGR